MSYAAYLLAHKYKIDRKGDEVLNVWDLRHFSAATWNEKSGIFQREEKKTKQETLHYLFPYNNNLCIFIVHRTARIIKKKKKRKISVLGIEPSVYSCVS